MPQHFSSDNGDYNTIQTSDVSNADDVNDEDDDDDRLTWIPNINYDLDDANNTFQTCRGLVHLLCHTLMI